MTRRLAPWLLCAVAVAGLSAIANDTPYLNRSKACVIVTAGEGRCGPPVWCDYVGLQGQRTLAFRDADSCPLIVMLPRVSRG